MTELSAPQVTVIGAGLAGAEAAWQAAQAGAEVILYEMRPASTTLLHRTDLPGELVGTNSLGVGVPEKASGLLKQELRQLDSLVLRCADDSVVSSTHELLVDRTAMAGAITDSIAAHPRIELRREEVTELPDTEPLIVATGPLTSQPLARSVYRRLREPYRFFYQASAPVVSLSSICERGLLPGSPRDPEDETGLNCLLDESAFDAFCAAVAAAQTTLPAEHAREEMVDRHLPIEAMVHDPHLLRRGPMNPGRLMDPDSGQRPAAIVRLLPEDAESELWRLSEMATGLLPEEQEQVFGMIPGLEGLEIVRPGQIARSVCLCAPAFLARSGRVRNGEGLFLVGGLIGTADYVEAAATGWLAGVNAARWAQGQQPVLFPRETMLAALMNRLTGSNPDTFAPQLVNFGMLAAVPGDSDLSKEERRQVQIERSRAAVAEFVAEPGPEPSG